MGGVTAGPRVTRVVIVPRNGLANRLQAWASADILAKHWAAPLCVVWEPEEVLPAPADVLFTGSLVSESFSSPNLIRDLTQLGHSELPRYLSRGDDFVVLAGHDRGEQAFMADLAAMVEASTRPVSVILIAGGNFHLPEIDGTHLKRGAFYRGIRWSDDVHDRVASAQPPDFPYLGLHIRQTDRSIDAPSSRSLRTALGNMKKQHPDVRSLFISADSPQALEMWTQFARREELEPWSLPHVEHQRNKTLGIVDAAADWLLLSRAKALLHPAASTFSTEAAAASSHPEESVALRPVQILRVARRARQFLHAGMTYRARRKRTHSAN